jgi:hypothetical protein
VLIASLPALSLVLGDFGASGPVLSSGPLPALDQAALEEQAAPSERKRDIPLDLLDAASLFADADGLTAGGTGSTKLPLTTLSSVMAMRAFLLKLAAAVGESSPERKAQKFQALEQFLDDHPDLQGPERVQADHLLQECIASTKRG